MATTANSDHMSFSASSRVSVALRNPDLWLVFFITLAAAVLRLHMLATKSLWIDEAASVSFARMGMLPFLKLLWAYQGNMALYYFLLRFWIHLGDSEFLIRSLSALLGIASVSMLYLLGKRLFERKTALVGATLLAVHSFHIHYSQEARAYSLLPLLLIVAAYFLVRALQAPERKLFWGSYAVSAALAVYAHIFAVLVLAAHAVAVATRRPFTVRARTLAATVAVFGFLISPMAAFVVLQHGNQIDWVARLSWPDVLQSLELLTGSGGPALLLIYLGLCAAAFLDPEQSRRRTGNFALVLTLTWLALPPLVLIAGSLLKPLLVPRYLVMCVPALALLAARGINNLAVLLGRGRWPVPMAASLILVVALSLWGTERYFRSFPAQDDDWRTAVRYILEHERTGDGAIFYIPNVYSYRYYEHRAVEAGGKPAPEVLYPLPRFHLLSQGEVEQVTANRTRVWLVLHVESTNPKMVQVIESGLEKDFQPIEKRVFPGGDAITVILYAHDARFPGHVDRSAALQLSGRSARCQQCK